MKKNKKEIIEYINTLQNYQGYVQFSDEKIRKCDIFENFQDIQNPKKGFIFEAHFYSKEKNESISIRQINNSWKVSITDTSKVDKNDIQKYISNISDNFFIKMAQIWIEDNDELCEKMEVKRLKKVVFVGFEGDLK